MMPVLMCDYCQKFYSVRTLRDVHSVWSELKEHEKKCEEDEDGI